MIALPTPGSSDDVEPGLSADVRPTAARPDPAPAVPARDTAPSGIPLGAAQRQRVLLLTGPSGAGKSRLAARLTAQYGWPVVRLDDFYREHDDPELPRSPLGIPDWDHADSWNASAAVDALRQLVDAGTAGVPVYDISTSSVVGHQVLTARPAELVVAEGLFAGRLVSDLRTEGLLFDVLCIRQNRWLTALRRLARDLAERRKPPMILVRRGWALLRDEPRVVSAALAQGARCMTPAEAEATLARVVTTEGRA